MLYATHIVPMELQQFNAAPQPPATLLHTPQDKFRRHGLADRTEDTPLGSSKDIAASFCRQPVSKVTVDELSVTLHMTHSYIVSRRVLGKATPNGDFHT